MHDFSSPPPQFFEDAGCVHATIWSGRLALLLITAPLVSYAKRNIKLRRHRFLHASFCMSSKRNAKSSRLGFVLHSRGIAICARATAHNVDMVLFSSQRLSQVTQWYCTVSYRTHYWQLSRGGASYILPGAIWPLRKRRTCILFRYSGSRVCC